MMFGKKSVAKVNPSTYLQSICIHALVQAAPLQRKHTTKARVLREQQIIEVTVAKSDVGRHNAAFQI